MKDYLLLLEHVLNMLSLLLLLYVELKRVARRYTKHRRNVLGRRTSLQLRTWILYGLNTTSKGNLPSRIETGNVISVLTGIPLILAVIVIRRILIITYEIITILPKKISNSAVNLEI